jgi:hypothetical protein
MISKMLLLNFEYKANIHARNNALRQASRFGHTSIVALLLEHKADICTVEDYKDTAALAFRNEANKYRNHFWNLGFVIWGCSLMFHVISHYKT